MIIEINTLCQTPIYEQIRNQVVLGIASKQLPVGDPLPSVRRLGADLGINLHTVNKAYSLLENEGYIEIDRRKGALIKNANENTEDIRGVLSEKLLLIAAECICHNINKDDYTRLCVESYFKAVGSSGIKEV